MQGDSCGPIPAAVLSVDAPDPQYHFATGILFLIWGVLMFVTRVSIH